MILVITGSSGAGKSTILKALLKSGKIPNLVKPPTVTTRSPREGEIDGVDYHFKGIGEFIDMIGHGLFLEWAEVHGNYYGVRESDVLSLQKEGKISILDLDIQYYLFVSEHHL